MNERIVKLFMESVDTNYIPLPIEDHIPSWTAKFAELIVQECVNVLHDNELHNRHISHVLREHFGVKE